jgi:hypothetical protein
MPTPAAAVGVREVQGTAPAMPAGAGAAPQSRPPQVSDPVQTREAENTEGT